MASQCPQSDSTADSLTDQVTEGGVELSPAEIEALDAKWSHCWSPREIADRLAGTTVPWYVAAGWALDLFHGEQTREHGDIEIAIPSARFPGVRAHFAGYAFDAVGSGRIWENAPPQALARTHQTWLRDPQTGHYMADVFREPHDGDIWIFQRDETIRFSYSEIVQHTRDGIPYLAPELVLLFKARAHRPKDQADFDRTMPRMNARQRDTLARLLVRAHPGHPWIAAL